MSASSDIIHTIPTKGERGELLEVRSAWFRQELEVAFFRIWRKLEMQHGVILDERQIRVLPLRSTDPEGGIIPVLVVQLREIDRIWTEVYRPDDLLADADGAILSLDEYYDVVRTIRYDEFEWEVGGE